MSSIQEKKFLCLIKLSYDISLKVTRAYTEINVLSKYDNRVSTFLKRNKHDIFHMWNKTHCCQCVSKGGTSSKTAFSLTLRQIDILFEFQGNGKPGHLKKDKSSNKVIQHCLCRMSERKVSLNDLDINLLEKLLKRFVILESDDKMWLSTIREIRNCIAHATSTTEFDAGRLDKWWMKLEGSIIGLVKKIPPAFYGEAIESQMNALKSSSMEAIYAKKLMEDVKAENMILLDGLVERSDTSIGNCEKNIKQAITENNNVFKRHSDENTGRLMRKLEELDAKIEASAKLDPYFRSDHDNTRKIHVACQVEADDIDEHLTIKNLSSDSDISTKNGDGGFKIVKVKQKCILLELTESPELLSSEESLLNAIDQLIKKVIWAGKLDTRVQRKMNFKLTFTSPLTKDELAVFTSVFCTSDRAAILDSDVMNQMLDCNIGRETREKQTQTEENLVDSDHSIWDTNLAMIEGLHTTVDEISKENQMLKETVDKDNLRFRTDLKTLTEEKERNLDLIKGLHTTLDIVSKTNEMLKAKIDVYKKENLSLKTDPKTLSKEMKRSKSPCYLSIDEEKMKLPPKLIQRKSRETKRQQQHESQDLAESVYDFRGKSRSLQS